jgi:outer membrane protein OmpA-like peptidoglycan-associated protein
LTAGRDGTVRIWDAITKKQIDIIRADKNQWFRRAYFGPQGNQILTINNDRRVKVWIMNSPKPFQKDESDKPFRIISPKPSLTNVDFGELAPGRSLDSLVKKFYHNPTEHPIKITGTFVAGEDKKDFSVVRGYRSFVLPPNETRDIELNHTPHSNGSKNAYVGVVTPTDTIKATLTGRTVKPGYDVPVDRLNFGSLDVDQDRDTTILLIENNKYSALKLRQLSIKGSGEDQFFIEDKAGEKTVQPRAKKRIKLRFHPLRRGRTNALLTFRVEDNTHTIQLFGEGYSPRTIHLTGKVLRKRDNKPLSAKIECYDLESNRLLKKTGSGQSGHYSLTMNPERKYRIVADKDDYVPGNLHLDFAQNFTSDSINRNIYLSSIDSGATVVLNNIFFAFNKARLTRDSKAELDRMSRFLEEYPDITVEISGHTDSIGSSQYNMNLSRERAEVVRKYLVESGIDAERITTKGYGETQPIADNETDRGRQQNRRVEFTITGYARSSEE